jgi:O-acetyl-ADP-ribose deacetylase (regulator of RNase III)
LKTLITRCLKKAEKNKLSCIAFPALGTGTLGYPPCLTAKAMFDAVEEYQKTNPKYLKTVHFVLFQDKEILSVISFLKSLFKPFYLSVCLLSIYD